MADAKRAGSRRKTHGLVALSSAAVLAVYSAGYLRTRAAAQQMARAEGPPRIVVPAPLPIAAPPAVPTKPAPPITKATPPVTKRAAAKPKAAPVAVAPAAEPAPVPVTPPPVPPATPPVTETKSAEPDPKPAPPALKDGFYYGWGTSRHGDIQASVVIENGRITAASISQCLTRYSCSWIAALPPQVVSRQSAEVDFVTGATQSTNAFYYAVLDALAKAK